MALTELEVLPNGHLKISLTDEGIAERDEMMQPERWVSDYKYDLVFWIEGALCNGWDWLRPEEIGALTEAPILSDDVSYDAHGDITHLGRVWWFPQYETTDPVDVLLRDGSVVFQSGE